MPDGAWLAPGFIDVQVNGGGDVLFNDDADRREASPRSRPRIAASARPALLPTLITDTPEKMPAAIAAVRQAMARRSRRARHPSRGAVPVAGAARRARSGDDPPPDASDLETAHGLGGGVTLVTLAPEAVPAGFIAALARGGRARVARPFDGDLRRRPAGALAEGLTGFTHLFNAMRPLGSRDPGPIAAALETPGACIGLIVDGEHVASGDAAARAARRRAADAGDRRHAAGRRATSRASRSTARTIAVRDGRCVRADGTLAGAALDMASAVRNCVALLGLPLATALRMATATPARFLGLADSLGRLAPGYRADLVAFTPDTMSVAATWVAGTKFT